MEVIKVHNYEQEHGQGTFPAFRQLDSELLQVVRQQLARALCLAPTATGHEMANEILNQSQFIEGVSADSEAFDLRELMTKLGLRWKSNLLLNWHDYTFIDEVRTEDMITHFSDIWYPSVDDLDIFDESTGWILSILHYGAVKVLKIVP